MTKVSIRFPDDRLGTLSLAYPSVSAAVFSLLDRITWVVVSEHPVLSRDEGLRLLGFIREHAPLDLSTLAYLPMYVGLDAASYGLYDLVALATLGEMALGYVRGGMEELDALKRVGLVV